MRKTKGIIAAALTATMLVGNCMTVLADPVTSGGTDGNGTSEGHVDKEVINVVLPTVAEGSTPFAYTMDPERLIQATDAAKYAEGTVFPDAEGDTGVYFLTDTNTYSNTSNTLQAINKSSCPITLTVKVKTTATAGDTDIALATSSTVATTGDPNLYLGLKVGDDTTVVKAEEQTVTKTIDGVAANFEVAVSEGAYVYQEKADATTWKAINISMEAAVSELAIAATTTAPTVNVTWSYAKAATDATLATDVVEYSTAPAAPSVSATTVAVGGNITITLPEGVTITAIDKTKTDGTYNTLPTNMYTLEDVTGGKKLTINGNLLTQYAAATKIKISFSSGDPIVVDVTAN